MIRQPDFLTVGVAQDVLIRGDPPCEVRKPSLAWKFTGSPTRTEFVQNRRSNPYSREATPGTATTPSCCWRSTDPSNESKGDDDASEWLPQRKAYDCICVANRSRSRRPT